MNYPVQQYLPQAYPQPQVPVYPPQYAQQPVPQQFVPGVPAPQVAPQQQAQTGSIDDFYNQPSTGGGPSISWKGKPDGTTYVGVVARDVGQGDVIHDSDPQTKQLKFYKDGRPMFAMKIPLKVQHPEFPEGDANLWVRGSMRDELVRAMSEVGASGAPKAGDVIQITLVQRKPTQGGIPANVFAIRFQSAAGTGAPSPAPVPAQQPVVEQVAQAVQQAPVMVQVPQQAPAYQPAAAVPTAPVVQQAQPPVDFTQVQVPQQQAPAPQAPALAVPENLDPQQAALLAKITGQQA